MTTEEKAKAYDEALNWMRELYPGLHGATKEDAEHYFPELAESEDERMLKKIIDYLEMIKMGCVICTIDTSEEIAWLEKQKDAIVIIKRKSACEGCNNVKGCVTCVDGDQWAHYEESEISNDLAMTWEDVQLLHILTEKYMREIDNRLESFPSSSQEMFEEILRRFNNGRKK